VSLKYTENLLEFLDFKSDHIALNVDFLPYFVRYLTVWVLGYLQAIWSLDTQVIHTN